VWSLLQSSTPRREIQKKVKGNYEKAYQDLIKALGDLYEESNGDRTKFLSYLQSIAQPGEDARKVWDKLLGFPTLEAKTVAKSEEKLPEPSKEVQSVPENPAKVPPKPPQSVNPSVPDSEVRPQQPNLNTILGYRADGTPITLPQILSQQKSETSASILDKWMDACDMSLDAEDLPDRAVILSCDV